MTSESDGNAKSGRDAAGRWLPGASPHSGGRPRLPEIVTSRLPELLALQVRAALEGRIPVMPPKDGETYSLQEISTGEDGADRPVITEVVRAADRVQIAEKLLDRILGRAAQAVELGDDSTSVLLAILRDKA